MTNLMVLDPTHEADAADFVLPERLKTLTGKSIGFVSNGKQGTGRFFDALELELVRLGVSRV
ncbi:MAG: UGSC family (seleno)protein, partial [Burkholderiaceae bacterium]